MTVTVASFRADLPEFADTNRYPDSTVKYWLAIANILMGLSTGSTPQVGAFSGTATDEVLTVLEVDFGSLSLLPLVLAGNGVPPDTLVTGQLGGTQGGPGTYNLSRGLDIPAAQEMVVLSSANLSGGSPYWGPVSVTATSPPTTLADFATEMFVAHQIVLEKQAIDSASQGGDPGTKIGVITSKSVGGVSVSFDVSQVVDQNSGYWGQTIYGLRFIRLARQRGMGPIQVGVGAPPLGFLFFNNWGLTGSYNAWAGPWPGIEQGGTGFGG